MNQHQFSELMSKMDKIISILSIIATNQGPNIIHVSAPAVGYSASIDKDRVQPTPVDGKWRTATGYSDPIDNAFDIHDGDGNRLDIIKPQVTVHYCPWCGEELTKDYRCIRHGIVAFTPFDTSMRHSAGTYELRCLEYGKERMPKTTEEPADVLKEAHCPLCGEVLVNGCFCSSHGNVSTLYSKYGFELQDYDVYIARMQVVEFGVRVVAPVNYKNML